MGRIPGRHWLNDYSLGRIILAFCGIVMMVLTPLLSKLKNAWSKRDRKKTIWVSLGYATFVSALCLIWFFWPEREQPYQETDFAFGTYTSCPNGWVSGTDADWDTNPLRHLQGGKETEVAWATEYMTACGIAFSHNAADTKRLVQAGVLVHLRSERIRLKDVGEPYVTPLMHIFTERLSRQYFEAKCGKLVITSALRNKVAQRKLSNGSKDSVHPTGMSIDLEIPSDSRCREWLQSTLLKIERSGRIDATKEHHPPHFHVTLVPWEYEVWLAGERHIDHQFIAKLEEVRALTTALYFESSPRESEAGMLAIASVIKNRRDSKNFPNTIQEVVADGSATRSNGGCQFSFMCDGESEQMRVICELHPKDMPRLWPGKFPCAQRWAEYHRLAVKFMDTPDNTGGAVLYYTGKTPYWAKGGKSGHGDLIPESIKTIGSHIFARSKWQGGDLPH